MASYHAMFAAQAAKAVMEELQCAFERREYPLQTTIEARLVDELNDFCSKYEKDMKDKAPRTKAKKRGK